MQFHSLFEIWRSGDNYFPIQFQLKTLSVSNGSPSNPSWVAHCVSSTDLK